MLYFFTETYQRLVCIVMRFVRFQESGFDISFLYTSRRFLYHIGIGFLKIIAIFAQLFFVDFVQVIYSSSEYLIVEPDNIGLTSPVGG